MNDKNIEEKEDHWYNAFVENQETICILHGQIQNQSDTLTQYKEALDDALDFLGKLFAQNPYDKDVEEIRYKLIKAKQLLNNE